MLFDKPLILLVDDDANFRLLARKALEMVDFEIVEAEHGEEAVEKFEQYLPGLVMLDVLMNKMTGIEACKFIRNSSQGKNVPIVMVTGVDDITSINNAYEAGATDFMTKPINWLILSKRIQFIYRASKIIHSIVDEELEKYLQLYCDSDHCIPEEFQGAGEDTTNWVKNINTIRTIIGEDVFEKYVDNILFEMSSIMYKIKHANEMSHINDVKVYTNHLKSKCSTLYAYNMISYCEILHSACEREIVTNVNYVVEKIEFEFFILKDLLSKLLRKQLAI